MPTNQYPLSGLTSEEVLAARKKFGENTLTFKKENRFFVQFVRIAKDPMMILLLVATSIYFISGKIGDGIFLCIAIVFQTSISLYQFERSKNALDKLNRFTQPQCKVFRNGKLEALDCAALVMGDHILLEEGNAIPADGYLVHSNDFSINESILTGESLAVFKDKTSKNNEVYCGTSVSSGVGIAIITAIGKSTQLGKIGTSLEYIQEEKTPLEKQIAHFVQKMAMAGALVFLLVWLINYWYTKEILQSLLQSLTLAMSILPEEIPVAFTTFMALGAWRLMKLGIVVKQMKTVETLGSASVICTDKTGTITENNMSVAQFFLLSNNEVFTPKKGLNESQKQLITIAMWASEVLPFDPMEKAIQQTYQEVVHSPEKIHFKRLFEYPLDGNPPMMTHILEDEKGERIIAAKGAPEALMQVATLSDKEKNDIQQAMNSMANEGYRVLGIGVSDFSGTPFPAKQQDLSFRFIGLVGFNDPPKKNIQHVLENFYKAGIAVKIITGDNDITTKAIAKQIHFKDYDKSITGAEFMQLEGDALRTCIQETTLFTRMFPEAKLKVIHELKLDNQIVAMTGDGVNDGPALKAAHIGIAMGKKGTEIAKQAASLILVDDDLSKMVEAIAMGRKIYANLKKAIQYIISIHIPIILTVFIPLALGWKYPNVFSPIHIIFLEIIMGPTCSIVYENEPIERNAMAQKPRAFTTTFFNWKELSISILQGLIITAGTLFVYQYALYYAFSEEITRTMTFTVLLTANIFLTLINRSFYYSILTTMRYKNNLVVLIIGITLSLLGIILFVPPVTHFFEFSALSSVQLVLCIVISFASVSWFEVVKWIKRLKQNKKDKIRLSMT